MDSTQPAEAPGHLEDGQGGHKYRPRSAPTLQLENRFEPLINLNETEVETATDEGSTWACQPTGKGKSLLWRKGGGGGITLRDDSTGNSGCRKLN